MKIRKGSIDHPTNGFSGALGNAKRDRGYNHTLHRSQHVWMQATDDILALEQTKSAAAFGHVVAKFAVKPAMAINKKIKCVQIKMELEWPYCYQSMHIIGINPLDNRHSISHGVWHEMGHLAHEHHNAEKLMHSALRPVYMAWRKEIRKPLYDGVRNHPRIEYLRFLVNNKSEKQSLSGLMPPMLWRTRINEKNSRSSAGVISFRQQGIREPYLSGWDEFLAEIFIQNHKKTKRSRNAKKICTTLEGYFPAASAAYKKALVDHRRVHRRKTSNLVLSKMAAEALALSLLQEPKSEKTEEVDFDLQDCFEDKELEAHA